MSLFGSKNKTSLKVEGMTCGHCVMRVTKALEAVEGVKKAKVDLAKNEAVVIFDGAKVKNEVLIKIVEEAGYKTSLI